MKKAAFEAAFKSLKQGDFGEINDVFSVCGVSFGEHECLFPNNASAHVHQFSSPSRLLPVETTSSTMPTFLPFSRSASCLER